MNGLPESVVTGIAQGNDGFLWLTTANSLVRFDGARFDVVPPVWLGGLGNRLLLGVLPGTERGGATKLLAYGAVVVELGPDVVAPDQESSTAALRDVTIHQVVRQGSRLLAASRYELFEMDTGTPWRKLSLGGPSGTNIGRTRVCGIDGSGSAWLFGSPATLQRFSGGQTESIELPFARPAGAELGNVHVLVSDQEGVLLVVGRQCFRGQTSAGDGLGAVVWNELPSLPAEVEPKGDRFVEDRDGNLWLSSERGIHVLARSGWLCLENTAGTGPADVRTMFADRSNSVWVGASNGLFRFRPRLFHVVHPQQTDRPDRVTAVLPDERGRWWLGVAGHPLFEGIANGLRHVDHPALVRAGTPTSLLAARDGTLWVGTSGQHVLRVTWEAAGEGRREIVSVDRMTEAPGSAISARNSYGLLQDRSGRIWAATSDGVFLYCPRPDETSGMGNAGPAPADGLIRRIVPGHFVSLSLSRVEAIRCLVEAADGGVWLGAETGGPIRVAPDGATRRYGEAEGFPAATIMGMWPDRDGAVWLATTAGLVRWDEDGFSRIDSSGGLPTDTVLQVVCAADGRLWIGTPNGIASTARDDLIHAMKTGFGRCSWRLFTMDDGLDSDACASGYGNLVALDDRGAPCFATENGLVTIAPSLSPIPAGPAAMPLVVRVAAKPDLDRVLAPLPGESREARGALPLDLPPGARDVRIEFTCPDLVALDRTRFRWRLDGVDADWSPPSRVREAVYAKLPAGSFRFRLQSAGMEGKWIESAAQLPIRVLPFFWETGGFPVIVALAGAGLGAGLLRLKSYRRWQARLERERVVHAARERIARDIHDDLGTGLTEIAMAADLAQLDVAAHDREKLAGRLGDIYDTAARLARAVDGIVWAVNPANDTLPRFLAYLGQSTGQFLAAAGLRSRVDLPEHVPDVAMGSTLRHHLLLATRESLHNVVKHASADAVFVRVAILDERLVLTVADDGRGFDAGSRDIGREATDGHDGLANIARRMRELGGECRIESTPGQGTRVVLEAPLASGVVA